VNVNASVGDLQTNMVNIGASIGDLQTNIVNANASITPLQTNMVNANASIDALQLNVVNINASISAIDVSSINASMTDLKTDIVNINASIGDLQTNIVNANASIDALQTNITNANASIGNISFTTINASIAYLKEQFVPIEWGKNASFPPADAEDIMQSYQTIVVRNFDGQSTDESLSFVLRAPNGIQSNTVQYNPHVVVTNATFLSTKGIVFGMKGHGRNYVGASYGSEVLASQINMTASRYEQVQIGWSSTVTLASLTGGKLAFLEFTRKQSNADDDYLTDIGVPGFDIRWI